MSEFINNPFVTKDAAELFATADLAELRRLCDNAGGVIPMAAIEQATGWLLHNDAKRQQAGEANHYSRVWQILRRDWLVRNRPELLVDANGIMAEVLANANDKAYFNAKDEGPRKCTNGERMHLRPVIEGLRNEPCSWGEINVRLGLPEGKVRAVFGSTKDIGLRIGKGGRFAYDDPTLYLEHRKAEGAQIPADLKGRPTPEQLLNYKRPEEVAAKPARKPRAKKAVA